MKSFTIKFYGKDKHEEDVCKLIYNEIVQKHGITDILIFNDYETNVGYHINGIFNHDNYRDLLMEYKIKSDKKDKRVYWHFRDIPDNEITIWLKYCIKRDNDYKIKQENVIRS